MSRSWIVAVVAIALIAVTSSKVSAESSPPSATSSSTAPQSKPTPASGASSAKSSNGKGTPAAQASPTQLPDISITATRITQPISHIGTTVTVINSQQIQDQKIQQTSDALREVPGVQVVQQGGPGTLTNVSIRGSNPDQVLTLLDGVEVNSGGAGNFDFANLTTDNVGRIEVIRGAGGSLYGSSAIGGVINQISQEGTGTPKYTLLSDGGNWWTQRQVATVNGAEGRLGYSGAVSYYSTSGFQSVNGQSDNLSLNTRLDWHVTDDTTVRGFARYNFADVGLPEFSNFEPGAPLDPTAHQRTEFMLFKGEIDSHITDKLLVRVFGSFVRDEIRLNKVSSPGLPTIESDDIPDEIRGANGEAVYTWTRGFDSLVGFDFKDRWGRDGDNTTFQPFPPSITVFHSARQEYAGYVQQQARLFEGHLLITGGFRVDGNSQFGKEVSPAWSVAIPFDQYGIILRSSYSEGFKAPTFDELYFPGFGNPNLSATTSSEYDGSIEKRFGEIAGINATYFTRRIHDLIVNAPCAIAPDCQFGLQPKNLGRADMHGVEVIPSLYPLKGFSLSGNFTLLDSTYVTSTANLQLVRVPKHSAAAVAEYKLFDIFQSGDGFTSALFYQFVGDRDDLETQGSGEKNHSNYQLFNLTLSYKMADHSLPYLREQEAFIRIQNLFDRNYSQGFGFPAPPTNFEAGIKIGL